MSGTTEGWSSADEAKERARESVKAAFERGPELETPPLRTCRSCGHEAATWRARCPVCDKRYDRRLPWLKTWMRWSLAVAALAIAGGIIATSAPEIDRSKKARAAAQTRAQAKIVAEEIARMKREQRPVRGGAGTKIEIARPSAPADERLASRRALYVAFQAGVLTEARRRVASKEIDPPVRYVHCDPLIRRADGGGVSDEEVLSIRTGRYDCVAVKRDVLRSGKVVGYFGTPFVGALDFRKGTWVICKDNKVPGERGKELAKVKLAPECIGAEAGSDVLNGYKLPDDR